VCVYFLSEDRYLGDGANDRRESLQDGRAVSRIGFSLLVAISLWVCNVGPRKGEGSVFRPLKKPFDREYLEDGKLQRNTSIRT